VSIAGALLCMLGAPGDPQHATTQLTCSCNPRAHRRTTRDTLTHTSVPAASQCRLLVVHSFGTVASAPRAVLTLRRILLPPLLLPTPTSVQTRNCHSPDPPGVCQGGGHCARADGGKPLLKELGASVRASLQLAEPAGCQDEQQPANH
jgi:hypothetical protein